MSELQTRAITGAILVGVVVSATLLSIWSAFVLWSLLAILGIRELRDNTMGGSMSALWVLIASASVIGLGYFEHTSSGFVADFSGYNGKNAIALLCMIWANDTMAYLGGMLAGRRVMKKGLAPKVSPNKSWEGAVIGSIFAGAIGYIFIHEAGFYLGLAVGILATFSDLIQSKAKRNAGIKDTGTLLPGHGGVLDRFDALLLPAPFTFITLYLLTI